MSKSIVETLIRGITDNAFGLFTRRRITADEQAKALLKIVVISELNEI